MRPQSNVITRNSFLDFAHLFKFEKFCFSTCNIPATAICVWKLHIPRTGPLSSTSATQSIELATLLGDSAFEDNDKYQLKRGACV